MSLVLQSSGGGSVTLEEPVTASNLTITVPAETGTMITTASTFAGTGPAFSAYLSSAQTITNNTATKVTCQTEEFDTNSNYDNATNYRFTPTVAGYYLVTGSTTTGSALAFNFTSIYKNGSEYKRGTQSGSGGILQNTVSAIVYFNGSTDYVELYTFQASGSSQNLQTGVALNYFQASMVRAA
jgi:hypothetical protein